MTEPTPTLDHLVVHAESAVAVEPTAGSRLEHLHALYPEAKAAADAANARLKDITDGIKLELTTAAPERTKVDLPAGAGPALRLQFTERWTLDSKKLKAEDPHTYVRYAKKGGAWSLKAAPSEQPGGER